MFSSPSTSISGSLMEITFTSGSLTETAYRKRKKKYERQTNSKADEILT